MIAFAAMSLILGAAALLFPNTDLTWRKSFALVQQISFPAPPVDPGSGSGLVIPQNRVLLSGDGSYLLSTEYSLSGDDQADLPSSVKVRDGKSLSVIRSLSGCSEMLAVSSDGSRMLAADREDRCWLWDTARWLRIRQLGHLDGSARRMASFSRNGEIIATRGADLSILLWSLEGHRLETQAHGVAGFSWLASPQNLLLVFSGGWRGGVYTIEPNKGRLDRNLTALFRELVALRPTDRGNSAVCLHRGGVLVLRETTTWKEIHRYRLKRGDYAIAAVSSDRPLVALSRPPGVILLVDMASGVVRADLRVDSARPSVSLSADGLKAAVADRTTLSLYESL
jgi:hypothetical protein